MTIELPITGYAVAGPGSEHAPAARRVELPPPGTKRRGGRLPLLALELAKCARGVDTPDDETAAVLFGTGLGCLTETVLFVEHMIVASEATPKPRAFSASVHNAIASKVALDLQARGECQTFSHGATSFGGAAFAAGMARARSAHPIFVGAVDEDSSYVARGLEACGVDVAVGEGGAVLHAGDRTPLATLRGVAMGRPEDPEAWLVANGTEGATVVRVPGLADSDHPFDALHPSLTATATALAVGIIAKEIAPAALGLEKAGDGIALVTRSRFGDVTVIRIEAP